jgi:hypothetical protein
MRQRIPFVIGLFIISLSLNTSTALACQPCLAEKSMKFEETARTADLILIGQRTDFSAEEMKTGIGPATIKVKIIKALKGEASKDEIVVKSWSGMCPYGIVINDNTQHVIFLSKIEKRYYAVATCSVKTYDVKDGQVDFEGEKLSLEDFELKLRAVLSRNPERVALSSSFLRWILSRGDTGIC